MKMLEFLINNDMLMMFEVVAAKLRYNKMINIRMYTITAIFAIQKRNDARQLNF